MLSPQIRIFSARGGPWVATKATAAADRAIRFGYGLERWQTCMLIMTNSSNGEEIYDALLSTVLADTFTPIEWQGFKPMRDVERHEQ